MDRMSGVPVCVRSARTMLSVLLLVLIGACASKPGENPRLALQRCDAYGHPMTAGGHELCAQLDPQEFRRMMKQVAR
jgi:hypothetical protein